MKKPNFIISGFPKCGTTSLYHYLNDHPEIYLPTQKELHYFTHDIIGNLNCGPKDQIVKNNQVNNENKYLSFFKKVKNEIAIGDASPSYINYPQKFLEIKNFLKDPKIIIMVRDPIDRAYSNYLHLKREGREKKSFLSAIKEEDQRKKLLYSDFWYYKFNSLYFNKIIGAKKIFSDVLVITLEELKANPQKTLHNIYLFLGVKSEYNTKKHKIKYNPGGDYQDNFLSRLLFQPSRTKNFIKKFIKPTPFVKQILLKISLLFYKKPPQIDDKSISLLTKFFKKDIINLEKMGVNVSNWRKY